VAGELSIVVGFQAYTAGPEEVLLMIERQQFPVSDGPPRALCHDGEISPMYPLRNAGSCAPPRSTGPASFGDARSSGRRQCDAVCEGYTGE
jgi:hypothetical protein